MNLSTCTVLGATWTCAPLGVMAAMEDASLRGCPLASGPLSRLRDGASVVVCTCVCHAVIPRRVGDSWQRGASLPLPLGGPTRRCAALCNFVPPALSHLDPHAPPLCPPPGPGVKANLTITWRGKGMGALWAVEVQPSMQLVAYAGEDGQVGLFPVEYEASRRRSGHEALVGACCTWCHRRVSAALGGGSGGLLGGSQGKVPGPRCTAATPLGASE